MKTNPTLKALTAALLLAAAPTGSHAASLLEDGDFDALPVGNAPNPSEPAGGWHFVQNNTRWEPSPEGVSIVPAPAGGDGNALRFSVAENGNPGGSIVLNKELTRSVTADSGQILNVSFDIYVEPGAVGPNT